MLPTRLGDFRVLATTTTDGRDVTVILVHGAPDDPSRAARPHPVACLLGDTFGSLMCDCHSRVEQAAAEIRAAGAGILIYVKPSPDDPFACPRAQAAGAALTRATHARGVLA